MTSIKIDVKFDDNRLKNMISDIVDPQANSQEWLAIHNTFAKRNDPYVPFLNGPLSQTLNIKPDGVTYKQIYARYQYYGVNFHHTVEFHPLASAMWDQAMIRDHREEFSKEVEEIIRRGLKNGG